MKVIEKKQFALSEAKKLFWSICELLANGKLLITDRDRDKVSGKGWLETVTFYIHPEISKEAAIGSVQYYGGGKLIKSGLVRVIELRFYSNFLDNNPLIKQVIEQHKSYRGKEKISCIAFEFSDNSVEASQFISGLISSFLEKLYKKYPSYETLPVIGLNDSIKEMPRY